MRNETRVGNYLWPRVLKLDYKKERFVLKVRDKSLNESVFAFNAKSKAAAKHLWKCASTQRDFFTSTRIENPMVAHRLMAGVSSAPARKSKFVLPPLNYKSAEKHGGGGDDSSIAANSPRGGGCGDSSIAAASPRSGGGEDPNKGGSNSVKGDLSPSSSPPPPQTEKIRVSSPTSIVDGRRQKNDRHSIASSPEKNASPRRADANEEDGRGVQMLAATGGLFTAAGGSPLSARSSHSSRYRRRPQSESEYSHKMGHNHNNDHRSRKSTVAAAGAGLDDGEGAGGGAERKQRKKSRGSRNSRGDGESGSDGSRKSRGSRARQQQKQRQSQDVMVDSGKQWAKVQQQQQRRQNKGEDDKENVSSVQDAGEVEQKNPLHHKKYRTRSKSPKSSKTALPPEIIQHIHHDLVDPRGYSDEQLRDIPFTSVETQQRPRRISPHAKAGRTAINAAVFQSGGGSASSTPPRHPGDGAEMKSATPVYRPGFANAASVKTGLANQTSAPLGSPKSLGQLKDEMSQQQRPKDWRQQLQQQQERHQRGEIGAVPTSGGGAFYFPNGIPSGYFSDATCNDVWADDEMEAEM